VKGVRVAAGFGLMVGLVIGSLFFLVPDALIGFFGVEDPEVLVLGVQLMRYLAVSGLFVTVALAYTGGLQGTGDTKSPLYISIVSQIVVPLGLCAFLDATRGLTAADIWLAIVLGHVTRATLSVLRFRMGHWEDIEVDISSPRRR